MKLFFDLETTGIPDQIGYDIWFPPELIEKYDPSRIIEIGIILVDNEEIIEKYNVIVKPDNFTSLNPRITELTGITDKQIMDEGKDFKQVIKDILPFFEKANSINAYNINFDRNIFLSELYRIHDRNFIQIIHNLKYECTFKLSKKILYLESYKLEKVYKELFKKEAEQDHRAFNDAILCKKIYYKLKSIYKSRQSSLQVHT